MIGPLTTASQPNVLDPWTAMTIQSAEAYQHPFLSQLKKGDKLNNLEDKWAVMDILRGRMRGVAEGRDVNAKDKRAQSRASLRSHCQKFREAWEVTKEASGTKTQDIGIREKEFQKEQGLKRLLDSTEMTLLSSQDIVANAANVKYKTRGAFRWLENDPAQLLTEYPIYDYCRVASACNYAGTLAAFTANAFRAQLAAMNLQRKAKVSLDMYCGLTLKMHMSGWMEKQTAESTETLMRRINADQAEKQWISQIDFFEFDGAIVKSNLMYNMLMEAGDDEDDSAVETDYTNMSGLIVNMDQWRLRFFSDVAHKDLPDLGSGPAGYYEMIAMLQCLLPAGQGRVMISSAS